ncbi:MAG: hypothetical protein ACYSSP_06755 [Planctomycetota bacterium]|jgi:hypothetical protein
MGSNLKGCGKNIFPRCWGDRQLCCRQRGSAPWGALATGSSPATPSTEDPVNKQLTETEEKISNAENQKLVRSLFFVLKNDPDFRLVLECWPDLSADLRQAIIKMLR